VSWRILAFTFKFTSVKDGSYRYIVYVVLARFDFNRFAITTSADLKVFTAATFSDIALGVNRDLEFVEDFLFNRLTHIN
jgi:uncharacterized membrane protein